MVPTATPELQEQPRPWVDATEKYSIVATLLGVESEAVKLRSSEGRSKSIPLTKLSAKDATYARLRTAPRVNAASEVLIGMVVGISDGDTIKIRTIDGETKSLRLNGIDAPESGQPFGTRAQQQLAGWVFQKEIRAEVLELDRYGRYIADVYIDGRWVNRAMVRAGLAWHYLEYSDDEKLALAEATARSVPVGVWTDRTPVAPWDWRSGTRGASGVASAQGTAASSATAAETAGDAAEEDCTVYITATGSKYHRAGCQHLAKSSRSLPYSEAKRRYAPCSRCKP